MSLMDRRVVSLANKKVTEEDCYAAIKRLHQHNHSQEYCKNIRPGQCQKDIAILERGCNQQIVIAISHFALVLAEGEHIGRDLMRAYSLIKQIADDKVANIKYIFAALIIAAETMDYKTINSKICSNHLLDTNKFFEDFTICLLLDEQEVLDDLKKIYAQGNDKQYALQLLEMSSKGGVEPAECFLSKHRCLAMTLLLHSPMISDQHAAFFRDKTSKSHSPKPQNQLHKSAIPAEQKKIQDVDPLIPLQKIYQHACVKALSNNDLCDLRKAAQSLQIDAQRTADFWKIIRKGFLDFNRLEFFIYLKEYGLYARLFPTIFSAEKNLINDRWLQRRIENINPRDITDVNEALKKTGALLVAKELQPGDDKEKVAKVHAAYQISVVCDEDFLLRVKCILREKEQFLAEVLEESLPDICVALFYHGGMQRAF